MNGRRLLVGAAAGLAGLTVGAGIAAAQSDDGTGTDDTVVEQDSTTDSSTSTDSSTDSSTPSTDAPTSDESTTEREGCEDGGRSPGQAPGAQAGEGESTS